MDLAALFRRLNHPTRITTPSGIAPRGLVRCTRGPKPWIRRRTILSRGPGGPRDFPEPTAFRTAPSADRQRNAPPPAISTPFLLEMAHEPARGGRLRSDAQGARARTPRGRVQRGPRLGRKRRALAGHHRGLRRDHPGSDAPGPGRPGCAAGVPAQEGQSCRADPHRPELRAGPGQGPGCGRRRLPGQTVRFRGTAGPRAGAGPAALRGEEPDPSRWAKSRWTR